MSDGRSTRTPGSIGATIDLVTLVAIAAVAYALASFIHEGIGHGSACLLAGGKPIALSSAHFECDREDGAAGIVVSAGGTVANLVAGALGFLVLRRWRGGGARGRYFLWLLSFINLLDAGGYFLFSGIANIGDWAAIIRGLEPHRAYRVGLTLAGVVTYLLFVILGVGTLRELLGGESAGDGGDPGSTAERVARGRRVTLYPYLAGGILSCISGAFNPHGFIMVAISAGAASFGGTSALAWMAQLLRRPPAGAGSTTGPALAIERSAAWIAVGAVVALVFVFVLGPGVRF